MREGIIGSVESWKGWEVKGNEVRDLSVEVSLYILKTDDNAENT